MSSEKDSNNLISFSSGKKVDDDKDKNLHVSISEQASLEEDPLLDEKSGLRSSDFGRLYRDQYLEMSRQAVKVFNGRYCYDLTRNIWKECDHSSGVWFTDESNNHEITLYEEVGEAYKRGLYQLTSAQREYKNELNRLVKKLNKNQGLKEVCEMATKGHDGVGISTDHFDKNNMYIGVTNGILNLETKELYPYAPELYITKQTNVRFNQEAGEPSRFIEFLKDIFRYTYQLPDLPEYPNKEDYYRVHEKDEDFGFDMDDAGENKQKFEQYELKRKEVEQERERLYQEWEDKCKEQSEEMVRYFQELLGYILTGSCKEHIFLLFLGKTGSNGKGSLTRLLVSILGDYAGEVQPELLISSTQSRNGSSPSPELMDLYQKRFVAASETKQTDKFDTSMIKRLTGGDQISGRGMKENIWRFNPTHTIALQTNFSPNVSSEDEAFFRRLHTIPFFRKYVEKEVNPDNPFESQVDKDLEEDIKNEYEEIFKWIVDGALIYQEKKYIGVPDCVKNAVEVYRKESDFLDEFINQCCIVKPNVREYLVNFGKALREWMIDHNMGRQSIKSNVLKDKISRKENGVNGKFEIKIYNGFPTIKDIELDENGRQYFQRFDDKREPK